jgi:hypothetical protein
MSFLSYLFPGVSVLLHVALLVLLLRGSYFRRYPILLLYCVAQLGMLVAEGLVFTTAGVGSRLYRNVYWASDVILYLILFVMVNVMTDRVLQGSPLRPQVRKMLLVVIVAAIALPFVVFHPYFTGRWFRNTSQLLSLGAAIMNLLLWTGILGRKQRDPQLMLVSAGLGVFVTGVAISYGFVSFLPASLRPLAGIFQGITHLASLLIWCYAFRVAPQKQVSANSLPA